MKRTLMFLIFLFAMIGVVGCTKSDVEELPVVRGETPPLPSLKSGETEIPVVLGSHSWESDVDMPGPKELLKDYEPVSVAGDAKVKVVFDYKPNPSEIYIREFDPNSGDFISEQKLEGDTFALWTISSRGGPRIYVLDARWGVDGKVVAAQATYYFQVAIKGIADASDSEIKEVSAVREAAWNDLSDAEKEEVIGDWKNAEVTEVSTDELPVVKNGGEAPEVVGYL